MALQIRRSIYRDVEGYTLSGTSKTGRRARIFVLRRETAERMRDKLNAGGHIDMEDFAGDKPAPNEGK